MKLFAVTTNEEFEDTMIAAKRFWYDEPTGWLKFYAEETGGAPNAVFAPGRWVCFIEVAESTPAPEPARARTQ